MSTTKRDTRKCKHCGYNFDRERAQCPSCRGWNIAAPNLQGGDGTSALSDGDNEGDDIEFIQTGPWDPCFGRLIHDDGTFTFGIPKGAVTLLGGKNGAGKSTLVLQICDEIIEQTNKDVLIVSVEEAKKQVRRLGKRLKLRHMDRMRMSKGEVDIDLILHARKPSAVIVDSLPRLCPNPDDAVEFAKRLKSHIEELDIPAIVINHINKEEEFAGLEKLQHEVDATLIFTIFDNEMRSLRSLKNRNGLPAEVFFDMTDIGLVEANPEEYEENEDE